MYSGMVEGGRELVDHNRVQPVEVEVDASNINAARHFLPRIPGRARGLGRAGPDAHPRAVLEWSAREQAMAKTLQTTQEVRYLPSIGTTNGRPFLDISRSCSRTCTHASCSDLTDLTVPLPPSPPHPSFPLVPPAIGRGARLLALLQSSPPPPPPRPVPSRVSKDHLPTAIVQPQRIPPPPPELDDDYVLLQQEQLALDDEDLDLANLWWD